jgi:hypothetical protein
MINGKGEKLASCHDCVIRGIEGYKPVAELKSRRRSNNQMIYCCQTHWQSRKARVGK